MPYRARLLGFAFTNADFLFEVDAQGVIQFAAGAANDLVKESGEALLGKPDGRLFKPSEGIKFATFTRALKAGDRAGPYTLVLATGIANIWARDAVTMAAAQKTLVELSGERFLLGLGVSHARVWRSIEL